MRKADKLLKAVSGMQHSQGALLLIRQCISYCKLAYSVRVVPPSVHRDALAEFSEGIRAALTKVLDKEVDDRGCARSVAAMIFTLVCSYRAILPRVDVPRLCWLDTPLNWVLFGRAAATVLVLAEEGQGLVGGEDRARTQDSREGRQ